MSYPEALRFLASKYNIAIEEEVATDEDRALRDKRDSLLHIHTFALGWFRDSLYETEEGKAIGLTYLKEREFREEIIRKFQLGYNPQAWDSLTSAALKEGYTAEYLEEGGLSVRRDERLYDRFRGRVIFPIHNLTGAAIAFAGRILSAEKNRPKYVNSPETEIYHKSRVLYGLYQARQAISSQDECLLVEGYTDVLSLHQAGIENVVASSGTSLTVDQIRLIRRFTENITILYDGDEAGLKASFRGIDMILEQGMNVRLVLFPEGEDPDSYVRRNRVNVVRDFIRSRAEHFIPFKAGLLAREAGNDPVKKAGGIKDIVASIALVPDAIKRNLFIRQCGQLLDMPEQTLVFEMNKIIRRNLQQRSGQELPELPVPPAQEAPKELQETRDRTALEKDLVRILLHYGELDFDLEVGAEGQTEMVAVNTASYILSHILDDRIEIEQEECSKIFSTYEKTLTRGELPSLDHFLNHRDERVARLAIDLVTTPHALSKNWKRHRIVVPTEEENLSELVIGAVNKLKLQQVERELESLAQRLREEEEGADSIILLQQQHELEKKKVEISRLLGRVISR